MHKALNTAASLLARAEKGHPTGAYFVPLESLRGIAALIVVVYHAVWSNPITQWRFFQNGPLMVDFFFVLSGFVIAHSYGDRLGNSRQVGRFLWLRWGRLYPLHFAFLLVFLGFEVLKYFAQQHLGVIADKPAFTVNNGPALLKNLLLIQSLGFHNTPTFNYPSWSISTEFYAYVLFAVLTWSLGNARRFMVAAFLLVLGSLAVLFAHVRALTDAGDDWGYFRCLVGFFSGTLCHQLYQRLRSSPSASWRWVLPAVALLTCALLTFANPFGWLTYFMPACSVLLILGSALWPRALMNRVLVARPLQWLGTVSYSLYMVHAALVWIFTQFLTIVLHYPKVTLAGEPAVATPAPVGLTVLIIYIVAVVGLSSLTYRFIEAPFRRWSRQRAAAWFTRPLLPAVGRPDVS